MITARDINAASAADFEALLDGPPETVAPWLQTAAEAGVTQAQLVLGQMLLDGRGLPPDAYAAIAWFRQAANGDHPMAMNMVGRCYENGWGVAEPDATVAAYWYRLAARQGLDWGMYNYATLLALGNGVPQDAACALEWFLSACRLGHAKSLNIVGGFYEDGWQVKQDRGIAFDHYRRAAQGGDFRGQFNYARLLAEDGRTQEAAHWIAMVPATATPAFLAKLHAFLDRPANAALADALRQSGGPATSASPAPGPPGEGA